MIALAKFKAPWGIICSRYNLRHVWAQKAKWIIIRMRYAKLRMIFHWKIHSNYSQQFSVVVKYGFTYRYYQSIKRRIIIWPRYDNGSLFFSRAPIPFSRFEVIIGFNGRSRILLINSSFLFTNKQIKSTYSWHINILIMKIFKMLDSFMIILQGSCFVLFRGEICWPFIINFEIFIFMINPLNLSTPVNCLEWVLRISVKSLLHKLSI